MNSTHRNPRPEGPSCTSPASSGKKSSWQMVFLATVSLGNLPLPTPLLSNHPHWGAMLHSAPTAYDAPQWAQGPHPPRPLTKRGLWSSPQRAVDITRPTAPSAGATGHSTTGHDLPIPPTPIPSFPCLQPPAQPGTGTFPLQPPQNFPFSRQLSEAQGVG